MALSFASVCLACAVKVNEGSSGDPPAESDQPTATEPTPKLAEVEAEPPMRASAPQAPDCPADADADTYCTHDNKLVGRWVPVDTIRPPAVAETIFQSAPTDVEQQPSLVIALDGETIYIKKVTCGNCRRVIGQGFMGDLSALSDTQIRDLQDKLGLGREAPLLDTAQAWRSYVSNDAGYAALTKLAATTS